MIFTAYMSIRNAHLTTLEKELDRQAKKQNITLKGGTYKCKLDEYNQRWIMQAEGLHQKKLSHSVMIAKRMKGIVG